MYVYIYIYIYIYISFFVYLTGCMPIIALSQISSPLVWYKSTK